MGIFTGLLKTTLGYPSNFVLVLLLNSLVLTVPFANATFLERAYERAHVTLPEYESDNLFDNGRDFLVLSQFIYIHAEMFKATQEEPAKGFLTRNKPSEETIKERKDVLGSANTVGDVLDLLHERKDLFKLGDGGQTVKESAEVIHADLGEGDHFGRTSDSEIVALHADVEARKRSCVYTITKHEEQKRVVVIFRGTSNTGDWIKDGLIIMKKIANPVDKIDGAPSEEKIGLHLGFARALLKDGKNPLGHVKNLMKEVKDVMEEHPTYKLFVTGHSLGGALATLFGFYVAASDDPIYTKNAPVRVFSVSSPRVGDRGFRFAFKALEERGKLRHARIYNARDKVPMLPYMGGAYKHVGLELKLRRIGMPLRMDYPRYEGWKAQSKSVSLWQQIKSSLDAVRFHGCPLIRERLRELKERLSETTLEEEYKKMWGIVN